VSAKNIRRQLAAIRARVQAGEGQPVGPDWSLLAADWPAFKLTLPVEATPPPEVTQKRRRLAEIYEQLNCTPADLGLVEPPAAGPPRSGFVEVPPPRQPEGG
jgi:hypothetical protein